MKPSGHWQLVTGRLAEPLLRRTLEPLARELEFRYTISVLPITVAALMTPAWIARHLEIQADADAILLPGYCDGDLSSLEQKTRVPVIIGPHDVLDLPTFFGQTTSVPYQGLTYRTEILAEINHAPRLSRTELLQKARQLHEAGADWIDVGCDPRGIWAEVGDAVRALRDLGFRVSIDSLQPAEIAAAVRGGAELVLSVNRHNREAAPDWGCEVVAIPDDPADLGSLEATIEWLDARQVPFCADPILEPIGLGFGRSLMRYADFRHRYSDLRMLMGVGNLTELTDVDSAGINVLLLALCEEWNIDRILTTQVIPWAVTSVRECDLARRLVHFAVSQQALPKHRTSDLILLRDPRVVTRGEEVLRELAQQIRDPNYRLFAEGGRLHLVSAGLYLQATDPFELFAQLQASGPRHLSPAHAFYLGYEMSKAVTALTLNKQYTQDRALRWGFLTREEDSHRIDRGPVKATPDATEPSV